MTTRRRRVINQETPDIETEFSPSEEVETVDTDVASEFSEPEEVKEKEELENNPKEEKAPTIEVKPVAPEKKTEFIRSRRNIPKFSR